MLKRGTHCSDKLCLYHFHCSCEPNEAHNEKMMQLFAVLNDISVNVSNQAQTTASLSNDQYASLQEISAATNLLAHIANDLNNEVSSFKL